MGLHDRVIREIASAQEGCVTSVQLIEAGVPRGVIARLLKSGFLLRAHKGVYVVAHHAPIPLQDERAALLSAGDGAYLVRRSAAFDFRLLAAPPAAVEMSVLGARRASRDGVCFHSSGGASEKDITEYRGLRVCSVPMLLLDICSEGETALAARLLNEARVAKLLEAGDLERFLERAARRRGYRALRELAGSPTQAGVSRSRLERTMRSLMKRAGLRVPLMNHPVLGLERDFVWKPERHIVETDGWAAHGTKASFEEDRRRDAELVAAGWTVQRITWDQLTRRPEWVVARIAAALAIRETGGVTPRGA